MAARAHALLFAAVALAGMSSCSSEKKEATASALLPASPCAPDRMVAGVCTGAPPNGVCDGDVCTQGVTCQKVVTVASNADLHGALSIAGSGTCIAVASGNYDAVVLPLGASLLGKGAMSVTVSQLTITAGNGTVVRGIGVGGGGLAVDGAMDARMDSITVGGGTITISNGASVTISSSEVTGSPSYGILIQDAGKVRVEGSRVQGSKGPGLWAECAAGCACANGGQVTLSLSGVALDDNRIVGISLIGVSAELDAVDVTGNAVADNFTGSGGLSASQCSNLTATRMRVLDNSAYGMLIDTSSATLGTDDPSRGIEVSRNTFGIWVQNTRTSPAAAVVLRNAKLADNEGVGIGLLGGEGTVTISASEVGGTSSKVLPSTQNGVPSSREVGHGVAWMGGARAQIDGLSLHGNKLASLLVDGAAGTGSVVRNLKLTGGDELLGVLQQNVSANSHVLDSVPPPLLVADQRLPIPTAPALPPRPTK
jgi:hypothetical protein